MSYLICESCNGYYELREGESPDDFESCHCGGNLRYVDEIIVDETPKPERKVIKKGKTFTANKSQQNIIIMFVGSIIALVGAIGIYWGYGYSFFMVIVGLVIVIYGYGEGGSWIKGDIGERITSHHLKKLPKEFVVFNDVILPERYGNIDHVVVGPTGIFVIETKNYTGSYTVDGDDWYYNSDQGIEKTSSNPAGQVKSNSMALKHYLSIKGINTYKLWINSVVALTSPGLTIKNAPKNYKILRPSKLPRYIENNQETLKEEVIVKAIYILEECATEII
jgi:hypothetical protein